MWDEPAGACRHMKPDTHFQAPAATPSPMHRGTASKMITMRCYISDHNNDEMSLSHNRTVEQMARMCGSKPRSSMRSASSSTKYVTSCGGT